MKSKQSKVYDGIPKSIPNQNKEFLSCRLCRSCRSLIEKQKLNELEFKDFKNCRCLQNKLNGGKNGTNNRE